MSNFCGAPLENCFSELFPNAKARIAKGFFCGKTFFSHRAGRNPRADVAARSDAASADRSAVRGLNSHAWEGNLRFAFKLPVIFLRNLLSARGSLFINRTVTKRIISPVRSVEILSKGSHNFGISATEISPVQEYKTRRISS